MRRAARAAVTALALWIVAAAVAAEEPVLLAGHVTDAVSGAPIANAVVAVGQDHVTTDAAGAFALRVGPGRAVLFASASGYADQTRVLALGEARTEPVEIALVPRARFSEQVEVRASPAATPGPAAIAVASERVMTVAGGLDNIFHVLQTLPGVVATDELGSRISVRGGSPDENLTIMDGVEIHNPYRLFGLTSAFNPETVSRFDFSPGGFGVSYGDRLSSLLVIENRDGTDQRTLSGSSAMSITDANVVLEGKLPTGRGSWLLTTRRTYYDLVAERFVHAQLPAFADVQLRAAWAPRDGQKLTLTAVRSREDGNGDITGDVPDEHGQFLLGVRNDLASLAFQSRVGRGLLRSTVAAYDNTSGFDAAADFRSDNRRSNSPTVDERPLTAIAFQVHHVIRDLSGRVELSLPVGARQAFDAGFDLHRLRAGVTDSFEGARNPGAANGSSVRGGAGLPDQLVSENTYVRGGAWLEERVRVTDGVTVVPGLRADESGITHGAVVSPRLSATAGLGRSTRLQVAAGLYAQSPGFEKLIVSDYLVDQVNLDYERARHLSVGVEHDLAHGLTARLEGYHKRFDHLIVGRLETESERLARLSRYDYPATLQGGILAEPLITSTPGNDARGQAYGLDLYVTRAGPRLSGWLSYTLGWARREAYGRTYSFDYDRRHSATLVGRFRFSPRFELSATARVASGFPRTPFAGVRVASVDEGGRMVPERDDEGRLVYVVAAGGLDVLNSARLPFYARLDLRAAFHPRGEKGRWQLYVEAINATGRKNVTSVDGTLDYDPSADRPRLVEKSGGSIPFLPTFGVRFRF